MPQHRRGGRPPARADRLHELRQSGEARAAVRVPGGRQRHRRDGPRNEPGSTVRQRVVLQRDGAGAGAPDPHLHGRGHRRGHSQVRHHRPEARPQSGVPHRRDEGRDGRVHAVPPLRRQGRKGPGSGRDGAVEERRHRAGGRPGRPAKELPRLLRWRPGNHPGGDVHRRRPGPPA